MSSKALTLFPTALCSILALTACSGGDDAPRAEPDPVQNGSYSSLQASTNMNVALSGKTITQEDDNAPNLVNVTATYNPGTDTLTYNDGQISVANATITSTERNNDLNLLIDTFEQTTAGGSTTTQVAVISFEDGTYQYARVFLGTKDDGTTDTTALGYVGVAADPRDVANGTGIVRYEGQATGGFELDGVGYNFASESTVDIDFENNTAAVKLRNIRPFDADTDAPVQKPITQIDVIGMPITGSTFSGGALSITDRNGNVLPQFDGITPDVAEGGLFGYDTGIHAPDETAGVVATEVDADNNVSAIFIAD